MRIGGARLARGGSVRCSIKQARVCFTNSPAVSHIRHKTWDAIFQRSKRDTFKIETASNGDHALGMVEFDGLARDLARFPDVNLIPRDEGNRSSSVRCSMLGYKRRRVPLISLSVSFRWSATL